MTNDVHESGMGLYLEDPAHVRIASRAVNMGAVILHGFANIYALSAESHFSSAQRLKIMCGRQDADAWVTTIPAYLDTVVEWDPIQDGIEAWEIRALISELLHMGPIGLCLPASPAVPDHLVTVHDDSRWINIMMAGLDCPSGIFLEQALNVSGEPLLAIEPACRSYVRGKNLETDPVHYRGERAAEEFATLPGVLSLVGDDKEAERNYLIYAPTHPSVLSFQDLRFDRKGRPMVAIETHGSLALERIADVLDHYDMGHVVMPSAQSRLPARMY